MGCGSEIACVKGLLFCHVIILFIKQYNMCERLLMDGSAADTKLKATPLRRFTLKITAKYDDMKIAALLL